MLSKRLHYFSDWPHRATVHSTLVSTYTSSQLSSLMYGRDGICRLKSYMTWIVRFSVILLRKLLPHFLIRIRPPFDYYPCSNNNARNAKEWLIITALNIFLLAIFEDTFLKNVSYFLSASKETFININNVTLLDFLSSLISLILNWRLYF